MMPAICSSIYAINTALTQGYSRQTAIGSNLFSRANRDSDLALAVAHEIARLQHQEQQQQQQQEQWPTSPSPSASTANELSVAGSDMLSRVPSSLGRGEVVINLEQIIRL